MNQKILTVFVEFNNFFMCPSYLASKRVAAAAAENRKELKSKLNPARQERREREKPDHAQRQWLLLLLLLLS